MGLSVNFRQAISAPKINRYTVLIILVTLVGCSVEFSRAIDNSNVDKELILTEKEKLAFDKFKAAVYSNFTVKVLKQDIFFLRFVREIIAAKNLDVDRAINDALQFVKFIRANKIENISKEDWNELEEEFPFKTDIVDSQGSAVGYGGPGLGGWPVRAGIMQGKRRQIMRYVYKIAFEMGDRLLESQKTMPNVTQFVLLVNLEGFNPIQHSCPACVSLYITLIQIYELYLPGYAHEIVFFNVPNSFLLLLDILRQFLSKHTNDALRLYGTNKIKWKAHLDSFIDPRKLLWEFGGTAKDNNI